MNAPFGDPAPTLQSMRNAAWTLLVLNVLDITLTVLAIRAGAHETNALAKFLLDTKLIFGLKVLVPGILLWGAYNPKAVVKITELSVRRAWTVVGIYLLVVIGNLVVWYGYAFG